MKNNAKKKDKIIGVPWNSIKESIIDSNNKEQSYSDALVSPCKSCSSSPCCTYLPLKSFTVNSIMDLDHAKYLLNFDRIELGLSSQGKWSAYYKYPCRFLDRNNFQCSIHDKPEQPNICKKYNPYNCWYKKTCNSAHSEHHIRIDMSRFLYILNKVKFDDHGKLIHVPAWDQLNQELKGIYDEPGPYKEKSEGEENLYDDWLKNKIKDNNSKEPVTYSSRQSPCSGCSAPCCKTLVFPQEIPQSFDKLDYFKFCIGFPGIELGISDRQWSLIVKSRCQHFTVDNKCDLFGKDERPLICKYYDEWNCSYKPEFNKVRPEGFMRLKYSEYVKFLDLIPLNENGNILQIPPTEQLREELEKRIYA